MSSSRVAVGVGPEGVGWEGVGWEGVGWADPSRNSSAGVSVGPTSRRRVSASRQAPSSRRAPSSRVPSRPAPWRQAHRPGWWPCGSRYGGRLRGPGVLGHREPGPEVGDLVPQGLYVIGARHPEQRGSPFDLGRDQVLQHLAVGPAGVHDFLGQFAHPITRVVGHVLETGLRQQRLGRGRRLGPGGPGQSADHVQVGVQCFGHRMLLSAVRVSDLAGGARLADPLHGSAAQEPSVELSAPVEHRPALPSPGRTGTSIARRAVR